ncbi:hypothetical protein [Streptosporangium sp. LJ11]|uniref:hypothetical protein n=1 Tax=Streptosporangium sp. LJ11 TaxID=3436927 RepID=UPI003F7A27EC
MIIRYRQRLHVYRGARVVVALRNHHSVAIALWFGALIALIAVRFWSFWSTLI